MIYATEKRRDGGGDEHSGTPGDKYIQHMELPEVEDSFMRNLLEEIRETLERPKE
jgi:hypothetical protein